MALLKTSAFTPIINGAVGGTIFSYNGGGAYIKNYAVPVNHNTIYQTNARALLATYAANWKGLSAVNQAAWIAWAAINPIVNRIGDLITMSGFNAYCMININIVLAGGAPILAPGIPASVPYPLTLGATCIAGVTTITFTATPVPVGYSQFIWATPPVSLGKYYVNNLYRLMHVSAAATASPTVLTTFYNARFGAPPAIPGARIFFAIQNVNTTTGQQSTWLRASCLTA